MVIAAVAACIVLSAATIDAQSWKRGLGKLKQGVEQVTRQSKPNTTHQSGDVQVPEWHEERAQKRTSGLPSSVDTVVNHLRYRLRPDKRYAEFMGVDDYLAESKEHNYFELNEQMVRYVCENVKKCIKVFNNREAAPQQRVFAGYR